MLIIHGRINSINVQKVVLACEELKLPYKRLDAGGVFGIVKTPEFMAMNPNSLVPVLIDKDLVLWESNSIVRYLAAKHGEGTLWPKDIKKRALSDRWMDWQTTAFYNAYANAFRGLVRTSPDQRNMVEIEASIAATHPMMAILEAELEGKKFLVGSKPTMGDIALVPTIFRWLNMPVKRPSSPNVEAWVTRLVARPGYSNALLLPVT